MSLCYKNVATRLYHTVIHRFLTKLLRRYNFSPPYPRVRTHLYIISTKGKIPKSQKQTFGNSFLTNKAERTGFEPVIRFWRIHAFQACLFNHSSTFPYVSGAKIQQICDTWWISKGKKVVIWELPHYKGLLLHHFQRECPLREWTVESKQPSLFTS